MSSYRLRDAFVLALFSLVSLRRVMARTERCHHPPTDFANAALVARGEELRLARSSGSTGVASPRIASTAGSCFASSLDGPRCLAQGLRAGSPAQESARATGLVLADGDRHGRPRGGGAEPVARQGTYEPGAAARLRVTFACCGSSAAFSGTPA